MITTNSRLAGLGVYDNQVNIGDPIADIMISEYVYAENFAQTHVHDCM